MNGPISASEYSKNAMHKWCNYFLCSILRKSSCPLPPEEAEAGGSSALRSMSGAFLKPRPALGLDGPRFLGLNSGAPELVEAFPLVRVFSPISRAFPPKTIGSVRKRTRPTS